jgi:hypothetical protein
MIDRSEHVRWLQRDIPRGDVVTIRIVDSEHAAEPVTRERVDPASDAERERAYYEHLRQKYEPEKCSCPAYRSNDPGVTVLVVAIGFAIKVPVMAIFLDAFGYLTNGRRRTRDGRK